MKQLLLGENGVFMVGELMGNHQETPVNIGKKLSQGRLVLSKECTWCGGQFLGTSRALFCQNKCRQKNKRWIKWLLTANNEAIHRKIDLLSNAKYYGTASYADLRKLTQAMQEGITRNGGTNPACCSVELSG